MIIIHENARKKAQILLGQIADGINPIAAKQNDAIQETTLNQVMQDYLVSRKTLKPKTLYDYNNIMNSVFGVWKNQPILKITKEQVEKLHIKLGENNGEAYANLAMRILRALFNFAAGKYEDTEGKSLIIENPVKRLSQTRAWYRRQEAAGLRWDQVDFKAKILRIPDTKNNEPHTLPLSTYVSKLLQERKASMINPFVFPSHSASGHTVEPKKQIAKAAINSGIPFTVHDLRRTFITIAESLDIPAYVLKRLLNHKMNNDVTAGYIVSDVERLRIPMQKITDHILKWMGIAKPKKTVINSPKQDPAFCLTVSAQ